MSMTVLIRCSAMVVAGMLFAGCGAQAAAWQPLADVVRDAETVELNATNSPASYIRDGDPGPVRQSMLDGADAALARDYAGPALSEQVASVHAGIAAMLDRKGGGRVGGVTAVELSDVQISTATGHAKARVTVWFKTAQFWWQDPRDFPEAATNVIDFDLHFVRVGDAWKISRESWQFAPGAGPSLEI
jgi:hypothetical protein